MTNVRPSTRQPMPTSREAAEIFYEICRDPSLAAKRLSSIDEDALAAMATFTRNHIGVKAESRATRTPDTRDAIALLISGGFDAEHLDQLWRHHLAMYGLIGKRVVAPMGTQDS